MTDAPPTFDWVAARGDKWSTHLPGMEGMLGPVDEPLIRALQLDAPYRIVDVGCGGGGTALELLRRAPHGSLVHGFDLSPRLVELARGRTPPGESALVFDVADMATAEPAKSYDRLVSRFGVMFFEDPRAAFANLLRWLRPGGRLAFAVWASLSENPWLTSVQEVVAGIVELPRSDPEAPGPFRYGDPDKLRAALTGAGFGALDVRAWRGALPIGGGLPAAEAAHFALSSFSSFGEQLAAAGVGAIDEARRALTARWSQHQSDGIVRMDASVHIFTGARP